MKPAVFSAGLAVAITAAVLWPLPLHLLDQRALSAFHDGHIWAFAEITKLLHGDASWTMVVPGIGHPQQAEARYIAWVPAVAVAPLQPLLGPIGAYNVAVLVAPALNVLAAALLLRRVAPQGRGWIAAAGALAWALSPYALGCLSNGQICKLQMWVLPLWAWAFTAAVEDVRPTRGVVLAGLIALAGSFSEPSYALHLPLLALPWGVGLLVRNGRLAMTRGIAVGLVTALALVPARLYYDPAPEPGVVMAHQPATRVAEAIVLTQPSPVATLEETLRGDTPRDPRPDVCNHPTYLTLPALLAGVLLVGLARGWRVAGAGTLVVGLAFAVGELLVGGSDYVHVGSSVLGMPARVLGAIGYPLAASGMYYRIIAVAGLGLAVIIAAGLARWRWGAAVAMLLALASVADGLRATRSLWPRPVGPVVGAAMFARMRADPTPGAVLDLPVYSRAQVGSEMVLASLLHGRATTALPRNVWKDELPYSGRLDAELKARVRGDPADGRRWLRSQGYRYVVLHTEPRPPELDLDGLKRLLGAAEVDGSVFVWTLEEPGQPLP